jgi:hypothetical protein
MDWWHHIRIDFCRIHGNRILIQNGLGRHSQTKLYRNHGSSDCDVTHKRKFSVAMQTQVASVIWTYNVNHLAFLRTYSVSSVTCELNVYNVR